MWQECASCGIGRKVALTQVAETDFRTDYQVAVEHSLLWMVGKCVSVNIVDFKNRIDLVQKSVESKIWVLPECTSGRISLEVAP